MNSIGTYGLGTPDPRPGGGGSASVMSLADGTQRSALGGMGAAAASEAKREIFNRRAEQEAKAGNASLGSTVGAVAGMALGGGPWGAAIGSVLGGAIGGMFD